MPRLAPLLLAAALLPAALVATARPASANSCETDLILPAHQQLPAGCPLALYARVGSNLTPGAITADRGGAPVVVGQAPTTSAPGEAVVHRTWFDNVACAWFDTNVAFTFDVFTVPVTSQEGDVLRWGAFPSVTVTAAAPCPAVAMSWQPACADPLPPPECVTPSNDDGGLLCDGGFGGAGLDAGSNAGIDDGGDGCQASRGGSGWLVLALAALVAARRRGPRG